MNLGFNVRTDYKTINVVNEILNDTAGFSVKLAVVDVLRW